MMILLNSELLLCDLLGPIRWDSRGEPVKDIEDLIHLLTNHMINMSTMIRYIIITD
jgi:hypothetical protein